ncbi:ATP-binding protein [Dactylosporangium darangshiense]|uniref:Orc1-like AAA ATPase domain-containing protein n=1 Tax=Dactylosporangium darangshiense TaxID=579108 RepID=A0ABP8DVG3_9ACTN
MGLFLGVGVGEYDRHKQLPWSVHDVEAVRGLLGGDFVGEVVVNPDEATARQRLRAIEGAVADGGGLLLMWSGHALGSPADLRLLARDSGSSAAAGVAARDVTAYCAVSGAGQLLLIFDTCFSGEALPAAAVAAEVLQQLQPAERLWVGVLAACRSEETAQDGLLGQRLRQLLEVGPVDPVLRVRWSVHNAWLRGDDLCDAVVKEWGSDRQLPQFQSRGDAWWLLPNPLYDPGALEQVVEHLLLAARGGGRADEQSWFTGRVVEVDQVVSWVRSGQPGVYVVTGSAGMGKSAIVGRVASLSSPEERSRLLSEGRQWTHIDPGKQSVAAHVHLRGLTADRAADELAGQLVRRGVLAAQEARRNAPELVGQVQRAVEAGTSPPVIVVDGLDEARSTAFEIAEDLLLRLARYAVVIVATRDVPRVGGGPGLVETLQPGRTARLDLDDPDAQERTARDVCDYVALRLADVDSQMDADLVAAEVAAPSSGGTMSQRRPFLLARLVTDQLRAAPLETAAGDWQARIAGSIEEAFGADLAATDGDGALARHLLAALTHGYGAGLPEEEWLTVANASRDRGDSATLRRDDLGWILEQLGRYVVQDGEGGVAVYRLAHQSLADLLRPPFRPSQRTLFDQTALPVVALSVRVR